MDKLPEIKPWRERTLMERLASMCERAPMYTGNRRFESLATFIDGYSAGLRDGRADPINQLNLHGFREWLANRLYASHEAPRNMGWSFYVRMLYPVDEEALRQLPILYEQFLNAQADKEP